jgi:hypothetical protein
MFKLVASAGLAVVLAASAVAQQPADLASKFVNDPGAPQVTGAKATLHNDSKVQGGKAIRITIPGKRKNVWDSAVGSALTKPVKAGDHLVLAFWARLEKGENGATTATLPYNAVQLAASPWTPLFNSAVDIGPQWEMHEIRGTADKDYAAGALTVTMHIATARQTIDVGPVIVLDLGQ